MSTHSTGDEVSWNWGNGTGSGKIVQIYHEKVTKSIKGTEVTRDASEDDPAYLIEQSDGDQVLKSASEIN